MLYLSQPSLVHIDWVWYKHCEASCNYRHMLLDPLILTTFGCNIAPQNSRAEDIFSMKAAEQGIREFECAIFVFMGDRPTEF